MKLLIAVINYCSLAGFPSRRSGGTSRRRLALEGGVGAGGKIRHRIGYWFAVNTSHLLQPSLARRFHEHRQPKFVCFYRGSRRCVRLVAARAKMKGDLSEMVIQLQNFIIYKYFQPSILTRMKNMFLEENLDNHGSFNQE